jgi:tetratricopeptide (TPR) repeat protein
MRRTILAAWILLAIGRGGAGTQDPRQLLAEAVQAHQQGRLAEAAGKYETLLDRYPQVPEVRSNLGAVYAALGRYDDAIAQYEKALDARPDLANVRLNLALALYKSARLERAAGELSRVLEAEPANLQALHLLADTYINLGNFDAVIELLQPLGKQAEDDRTLAYALGTAYIRKRDTARGQPLVDRLFRDGESAEALMLLAAAQMSANDFAGARDNLAKAVARNTELPGVHRAYAMALMATGDQAGARVEFEQELARNANDFEANLNMAAIHKKEREMEPAEKYIAKALDVRPESQAARYQLATVQMATGRFEEARAELEGIVAAAPDFIEAHVSLATVYYRLDRKPDGDRERAIVRRLTAERQAKQPGARENQGPAFDGETPGAAAQAP